MRLWCFTAHTNRRARVMSLVTSTSKLFLMNLGGFGGGGTGESGLVFSRPKDRGPGVHAEAQRGVV